MRSNIAKGLISDCSILSYSIVEKHLEKTTHQIDQFLCINRLGDITLRPLPLTPDFVRLLIFTADDNDRNVLRIGVAAYLAGRLKTIHIWHNNIHENHIGLLFLGHRYPISAIFRGQDLMPKAFKHFLELEYLGG
jgi:hypothetical protein